MRIGNTVKLLTFLLKVIEIQKPGARKETLREMKDRFHQFYILLDNITPDQELQEDIDTLEGRKQ